MRRSALTLFFYAIIGFATLPATGLHPRNEDLSLGTPDLHPRDEDLSQGTPGQTLDIIDPAFRADLAAAVKQMLGGKK